MHELSIASTILETVLREVEHRELKGVRLITLAIGELTAVVPDALQFGFAALSIDTQLANTELLIKRVPLKAICCNCGVSFRVKQFAFVCPHCGGRDVKTVQGEELHIVSIEALE